MTSVLEVGLFACLAFGAGAVTVLVANRWRAPSTAGGVKPGPQVWAWLDQPYTGTSQITDLQLRDLVSTLDLAAIMVRHFQGTIEFWSHGCQQLYGWRTPEALGLSAHQLLDTVFPVPQAEIDAALLRYGEWNGELVQRRRDGERITVSVRKVLKRDASGMPRAVMESLIDVTGLRQAQAELERLNQLLEGRVAGEVVAREAAQSRAAHAERTQALGQLAGGIAHDFNNVLQAISGSAALIVRRADDAEAVRRLATLITEASGRGASITRRMLAFARKGELVAEVLTVAEVLDEVREICRYTMGPNVRVEINVDDGVPPVLADKGQLETALVNLAANARDAMPEGGVLTMSADSLVVPPGDLVRALPPGRYVRMIVRDTGVGMDDEVLARAGEPFFTTKGVGKGTGLGLSMVKGFAEQSGGAIDITSTPGSGTAVTVWLPSAEPEVAAEPGAESVDPASDEGEPQRPWNVLLVDDDPLVRETLRVQIEAAGHTVLTAGDADEGLLVMQDNPDIDILVTDFMMPGKNGLLLIRDARAIRPGLPTILLTGHAGDTRTLQVSDTGNELFALLRKPIGGNELLGQLAALIERAA